VKSQLVRRESPWKELNERVLYGVVGVLAGAAGPQGEAPHVRLKLREQSVHRRPIAVARSADQLAITTNGTRERHDGDHHVHESTPRARRISGC